MQPSATGLQSLVFDQALAGEVDAVDRKLAGPEIIQQLALSLGWSQEPEGLFTDNGLNLHYSPEMAWKNLGVLERISALYRSLGFTACINKIPTLCHGGHSQPDVEGLCAFQRQVSQLNEGVITLSQINHYTLLRTRLIACTRQLLDRAGRLPKLYTVDHASNQVSVSVGESVDQLVGRLTLVWSFFDHFFVKDSLLNSENVSELRTQLEQCLSIYKKYQEGVKSLQK